MDKKQLDRLVWNELFKEREIIITQNNDGSYIMNQMPFHAEMKSKANDNEFLTYRFGDNFLSYDLISIGFDNGEIIGNPKTGETILESDSKLKYKNCFGSGIDIDVNITKEGVGKNIVINSLSDLGEIPDNTEYVDVLFKINTNFDFSFLTEDEFIIGDVLYIDSDSYINKVKTWDLNNSVDDETKGILYLKNGEIYLKKQISVEYLKSAIFPVYSDLFLSFGVTPTGANFGSSLEYPTISKLDSTHFVVAYPDISNLSYGTAIIGTINGGRITYGSAYVFNYSTTSNISVISYNSTHFVVAYTDAGNNYYGTAMIGTVTGTAISYGSGYVFSAVFGTSNTSVSLLDSTHFVVAYNANSNGSAVIGTISGTAISYGSTYVFNAAAISYTSVSVLNSTHFVVAYRDDGNSNYGTAIVGTVSGTAISYGSEYVFNTANSNYTSVSLLDSTHFVVVYTDEGNGSYGTAIIGTVSGTAISYGSEYVFNAATTINTSVSLLDSTHFVVAYRDSGNSNYGTAIVGTVSGSVISYGSESIFYAGNITYVSVSLLDDSHFLVAYYIGSGRVSIGTVGDIGIGYGSEYVFNAAFTQYISSVKIDSTHFITTYQDGGNSNYGTAIIGTISLNNVISYGSEYVFNPATTTDISVSLLDSTHFVVTYSDGGNSYYGTAIIGTVSGTAISYGSEYVFNAASTTYISATMLDSTHFIVGYKDGGNSSYGTAIIGTVSGSAISYGSEYVFNAAATDFISVSALDTTHFVVTYSDGGNSYYGTAIIGTVSGTAISYGSEYVFKAGNAQYISSAKIDGTHFVVAYSTAYGAAVIGTVSGSVISYGNTYWFNNSQVQNDNPISLSLLDSTHFVVAYGNSDIGGTKWGAAVVGTINGTVIDFNVGYMFNGAYSWYLSTVNIDATHFVVTYYDGGNSYYGTAIVGQINYDELFFNYSIYNNNSSYISIAKLDSTHFVITYADDGNSSYGTAIIGTVTNGVISYGSEYVFNTATTDFISVSALDSTHFVVTYRDGGNSNYGTGIIGTVSGTAISYGSEYVFNTASTSYKSVMTLDSTHFVVVYSNVGGPTGSAVVGTVSGTAISYGTVYGFNTATNYTSAALLDSTHFIVGFSNGANSSYGTAIIGTISGTAISYGSKYVFNSASTGYISAIMLDSTHFVIAYADDGNSSYGTAIVGTVSGTVISYGSEYVFNAATTTYVSATMLDSTHFIVTYTNGGNSSYETTIVGTVSGTAISYGSEYVTKPVSTTYKNIAQLDSTHAIVGDSTNGTYITYSPTIIGKIINAVKNLFWNAVKLIKWNNA
jgi:hypothetical protein